MTAGEKKFSPAQKKSLQKKVFAKCIGFYTGSEQLIYSLFTTGWGELNVDQRLCASLLGATSLVGCEAVTMV